MTMPGERTPGATGPDDFEARVREQHLAPLWDFFHDWFRAEPQARARGHLWQYASLRPLLLAAEERISAAEAERRVLVLENPGLAGERLATDSLYAGLQLIVPGEHAPSHRHTPAALRFIVEGDGAYTAVDGERAYMQPGDFIVTPAWTWHEHANEGDRPTVWLDVLDVALVRFLGAGFSERFAEPHFPDRTLPLDSHYRYGSNMAPVGYAASGRASPVFSYPYARSREVLEKMRVAGHWQACHAIKMEFRDPTTGGPAIPTLSTFLQLLPSGTATDAYRSTAGAVYCVVEGSGRATIAAGTAAVSFRYSPRDIFVVPGWQTVRLEADSESVLFSASDEAVQRKLGLFREEQAAALPSER